MKSGILALQRRAILADSDPRLPDREITPVGKTCLFVCRFRHTNLVPLLGAGKQEDENLI